MNHRVTFQPLTMWMASLPDAYRLILREPLKIALAIVSVNTISDYHHCSQVKIWLKTHLKLLSLHPNSISSTMTLSWWLNEWQILVWLLKLKQFKMQCITNIIFRPNFGDSQQWPPQESFHWLEFFNGFDWLIVWALIWKLIKADQAVTKYFNHLKSLV